MNETKFDYDTRALVKRLVSALEKISNSIEKFVKLVEEERVKGDKK